MHTFLLCKKYRVSIFSNIKKENLLTTLKLYILHHETTDFSVVYDSLPKNMKRWIPVFAFNPIISHFCICFRENFIIYRNFFL